MAFHVMAGVQQAPAHVEIRKLSLRDLRVALAAGWSDFLTVRSDILFVGLIYPIIGLCLAVWSSGMNLLPLLYPLASGFALLGPFAAIVFYEISRRRQRGLDTSWRNVLDVWRTPSLPSVVALGVALTLVFLLWLACAQALYQGLFGDNAPASYSDFAFKLLNTREGAILIVAGNAIGFVFAASVFAATVVAFPLLLDRDVGIAVAVSASFRAVVRNPVVMAVWGLLVAILLALGFATMFIGLAVVIPVLGHATWHLYRAVVAPEQNGRRTG